MLIQIEKLSYSFIGSTYNTHTHKHTHTYYPYVSVFQEQRPIDNTHTKQTQHMCDPWLSNYMDVLILIAGHLNLSLLVGCINT